MPNLVLYVGSRSEQGVRSNNEDNFVVDLRQSLFVVADGMGGQDRGEVASSMAVEMIPRSIHDHMMLSDTPDETLLRTMFEVNDEIVKAGRAQAEGRRMGTTAVVAFQHDGIVYVTHLGDSRAYLIRNFEVRQLTEDHSVAQALVSTGALSPEEARSSPYQHVLHKYLGCADLQGASDIYAFIPEAGDRLLLGTDGLTNFINDEDLSVGPTQMPDPQEWINHLVDLALERGSRDNVTGVVVAFEEADE